MNERVGFDCVQVLLSGCSCTMDLDEAMRILNNFYRVYREQLLVLDEINGRKMEDG